MRPIKLTICGVGSYSKKTEIDMSLLGESGLYLITGTTGSGKSTIFDAITFALYGEPSGNVRNSSILSSDGMSNYDEKYVELEYVHQGNIYKIKRSFEYTKLSKRNDKSVQVKPDASIILPDETVITGYKNVISKSEEILGLNREQFTKTVMIAQGEFAGFLRAKSDDKIIILRDLFQTGKYKILLDKLKEKLTLVDNDFKSMSSDLKKQIGLIYCDDSYSSFLKINDYKQKVIILDFDEAKNVFSDLKNEENKRLTEIKNNQAKSNTELDIVKEELSKAEQSNSIFNLYETALVDKSESEKLLSELKVKLSNEEIKQKEKDELIILIRQSEQNFDKYDELDILSEKIQSLKIKIQNYQNKLSFDEKRLNDVLLQNEKAVGILSGLENVEIDKERLDIKKSECQNKLEYSQELIKNIENLENKHIALSTAQTEYETQAEKMKNISTEYLHKEKAFLDEQAGVIASMLKEGECCPVCGSKEHPNPAKPSFDAPSKEELNELKEKRDKASDLAMKLSEKAQSLSLDYKYCYDEIVSKTITLINESDINKAQIKLTELINVQKEELASIINETEQISSKIIEKQNQKILLEKLLKAQKELEEQIKISKESIIKIDAVLPENIESFEKLKSEMKYSDKNEALLNLKSLKLKKETLEKAYNEAKSQYEKCNQKWIAIDAKILTLKTQLIGKVKVDVSKFEIKKNELLTTLENLQQLYDKLNIQIKRNEECIDEIIRLKEQIDKKEIERNDIKKLYDTANGTVENRTKIRLEAYVQIAYFERVIRKANLRLEKMSDGKLELRVGDDSENYKSQKGLDVSIYDHYTGKLRNVNTLSGGEMFMASLSLALGLSDEIQSGSGGINMDTFFIDEGFGSLSDDVRDSSIKALSKLSENRLIGIISHVSELKEKIEKKIVVTKNTSGVSSATIEV